MEPYSYIVRRNNVLIIYNNKFILQYLELDYYYHNKAAILILEM